MLETVFQENSASWRNESETQGMLNEPHPKPGWWKCEELEDGGRRWEWVAPLDAWDPERELDDGR